MVFRVNAAASERGRWYPATLVAAAITCALGPAYTVRWPISIASTTLLEVAILVTIAVFLVETYRGPRAFQWRTPFTYPALLFLVAGAISIVAAPNHNAALGLYRAYFIETIAFFFVLSTVARTAERALIVMLGFGVGAVALAVPNAIVVLDAIVHHTLRVETATPVTIYTSANAVALYLEPLIAVGASLLLFNRDRLVRIVSLVVLAIIVPAEILTLSRGGFLAMAVVAIGLALAHRKRVWLLGAAALLGVLVSRVPIIAARLAVEVNFHDPGNTLVGRSQLWSAALRMLRDHPLFGAGLAGFTRRLAPYWNAHHKDRYIFPHNIVLNFWSETGLLGVVAFAWIVIVGFVVSWRGWRRTDAAWQSLHLGVFLALVAVVVHGLVDVPYFKNDLSFEFWALLGITWAGTRWTAVRKEPDRAAPGSIPSPLGGEPEALT
jgi:O-antigen ligase